MATTLEGLFLKFATGKLTQLTSRIVDCLGRLSTEQIWARGSENQNAVGNLVLHLCGNVRQWILSGIAGRPDVRQRDAEFAARAGASGPELAAQLESVVAEAVAAIRSTTAERLVEPVRIQGYDVSVLEAIGHVTEHFAQHTGQIIFATKLLTGEDLGYYRHLKAAAHGKKTP
ncbi:MAG: DinB family protein [Rhodospirillales bacterium]